MASHSLLEVMGCCVARGRDDDEKAKASKVVEDWFPFLLHQLAGGLHCGSCADKVISFGSPTQSPPFWEPAEEPEPAISRSRSDFARFTASRKGARPGSPQGRIEDTLSAFRMVEAYQEVKSLQATAGDVLLQMQEADLERTLRIGGRSQQHLEWWLAVGREHGAVGSDWPMSGSSEELQLEWGFRLEGGLVHATFSTQVPGGDLARAVAALCELQLYGAFNDEFVEASSLQQDGAANDCIWQLVTHNKLLDVRADNIWQVSITDALESVAGAVIVDLRVPEQVGSLKLRGTTLPQKREGFSRLGFGHSTYFLFPVAAGKGEEPSFRLVNYSVTRPVAKLACVLSALPCFAQSRILRAGAERMVSRLKQHITMPNNKLLDTAMLTSPRTVVYEAVRTHLAESCQTDGAHEQEFSAERFYSFEDDLDIEAFMPAPSK